MFRDQELRPTHHPKPDKAYNGDRHGDVMDVDLPCSDPRCSSLPPNQALSLPLLGKLVYPPPPLHMESVSYADSDQQYTGDQQFYPEDRQHTFDDVYYSYNNTLSCTALSCPSTAYPDDHTYPPRDFSQNTTHHYLLRHRCILTVLALLGELAQLTTTTHPSKEFMKNLPTL